MRSQIVLRATCLTLLWHVVIAAAAAGNNAERDHVHIKVLMPEVLRKHVQRQHKVVKQRQHQHQHHHQPRQKYHQATYYTTSLNWPPPVPQQPSEQHMSAAGGSLLDGPIMPMMPESLMTSPNYGPALFDNLDATMPAASVPPPPPQPPSTAQLLRELFTPEMMSALSAALDAGAVGAAAGNVPSQQQAAPAMRAKPHKRKKYGRQGIGESSYAFNAWQQQQQKQRQQQQQQQLQKTSELYRHYNPASVSMELEADEDDWQDTRYAAPPTAAALHGGGIDGGGAGEYGDDDDDDEYAVDNHVTHAAASNAETMGGPAPYSYQDLYTTYTTQSPPPPQSQRLQQQKKHIYVKQQPILLPSIRIGPTQFAGVDFGGSGYAGTTAAGGGGTYGGGGFGGGETVTVVDVHSPRYKKRTKRLKPRKRKRVTPH